MLARLVHRATCGRTPGAGPPTFVLATRVDALRPLVTLTSLTRGSARSIDSSGHHTRLLHASGPRHPPTAAAATESKSGPLTSLFNGASSTYASADVAAYLSHYPRQQQWPLARKNLDFYLGRISSAPSGAMIDTIHAQWYGDYDLLEAHHGYIQWLFPIREPGLNSQSQVLYLHEIEGIKSDPVALQRVIRSYELMLDFYGMRLVSQETGEVTRKETNYEQRYRHLNRSTHNYLRITRILKCLGELSYEHLKLGFLLHIVRELSLQALSTTSVGKSARDYWFPILRDRGDQKLLRSVIQSLKDEEERACGQEVHLSEERIREVLREARTQREQQVQQAGQKQSWFGLMF